MNKLLDYLSKEHIDFKLHHHPKVLTLNDVRSELNFEETRLVKTLVFKVGEKFILVALRGLDLLDYKKLSAYLKINRSELTKPESEEIENMLGFDIGGIPPFTKNKDAKIVYDLKVKQIERMYCGSGKNTETLEVNTQQIISLFKPDIAYISK